MPVPITVIIPNWNGCELLGPCLESLERQTFRDFEVLVVDNGSQDGSREMMGERFPSVRLLALPRNIGFGRAINRGIEGSDSPLIFLLNNDTEVDPRCLDRLHDHLTSSSERCAGVQCRMMNFRERDRIDSLGIRIQGRQFSDIAFREPLTPAHERGGRILGPCAGAAIYRRTFFERVGLFDRRFFAGYEDVDIALRGIRRGFHFDYEPQAVVFHHRSPTLDKLSSRKHIEMRKNYFLLALKNYPRQYLPGLGLEMLRRMFRDLLRIPAHIRRGRFGAVLRMYMTICASLPSLFRERRDAVLGDAEFRAILDRSEREAIWRESGTPSAG